MFFFIKKNLRALWTPPPCKIGLNTKPCIMRISKVWGNIYDGIPEVENIKKTQNGSGENGLKKISLGRETP